jgi:hypothetical protein
MDRDLLDSVIKLVTEDKDRVNEYEHFDKLLLTFTEEEIIYFLNCCDEDLFLNDYLFMILVKTIPHLLKDYVEEFVKDRLDMIDNMEKGLKEKFFKGEISKLLYEETIQEYKNVRESASKFKILSMAEIEKELRNKKND